MKLETKLNLLKTLSYVGVTISTFGLAYSVSDFIQSGNFLNVVTGLINLVALLLNVENISFINFQLNQVKVPVRSEVVRRD